MKSAKISRTQRLRNSEILASFCASIDGAQTGRCVQQKSHPNLAAAKIKIALFDPFDNTACRAYKYRCAQRNKSGFSPQGGQERHNSESTPQFEQMKVK